ncbi:Hpt domain-containing protein [Breznakiella homolactica]|uniref:Hpt domain-containing protein n=1 Tax=Breznakiella homolactica TaxID=2798577 RepID=A0A7T7XLN3_9SPIR|nr:Hpt domain-containing protein [Breznakiella homolactica]QQO08576.1 Hpt domain-containing protein [Breznakiella homolactica]
MSDVHGPRGTDSGDEYIYWDEGLKRVLGNKNLFIKLLKKFQDETNFEELAAAIDSNDMEDARGKAHTLKGIAANLSLNHLYLKAQELETQIKTGSVDPAMVEAVRQSFTHTLDAIDKVIAQHGNV